MSHITPRNTYALLQYYLRERLWRHAYTVASDAAQALNDNTFRLWKAFALDMEGSVADALREYKLCEGRRDVHAAALTGLQIIYRRNNDKEATAAADAKLLQDERSGPSPGAIVQTAALLLHAGDHNKAREVIARVLDQSSDYRDEYTSVQLMSGWIDVTSGRGVYLEKAVQKFDAVLSFEAGAGMFDVDATMGRIAYLERKQQHWPAQEVVNKLIVAAPWFVPALLTKARQLMKMEDWDQAAELTQRVLAKDATNVEAITLAVLYLLVKEARPGPAMSNINDLLKALAQREPRNASLYFACGQCFSRLAAGHPQILALTTQLLDAACHLQPTNTDFQAELAHQSVLKGDYKAAQAVYKKASTTGDGNFVPLLGLVKCTLALGKLTDAEQQIDFLNEIQTPQSKNAELLLLHAMLMWRKNRDQPRSIEKLDQAFNVQSQAVQQQPTGMGLYTKLNPPLMLELAREYMQHCRTEPAAAGQQKADPVAEKARQVLDLLLRHVPGSTEAQLLSGKVAFLSGDVERAQQMLAACLRQDSSLAEAHLLLAQVHHYAGNTPLAMAALEQALSLDFEVKDQPQYNLLRGIVRAAAGEHADALQSLEHALRIVNNPQSVKSTRPQKPLSIQDHVTLYLQLAQVYAKQKSFAKAAETVQEAANAFKDSSAAGRITVAHAMLLARTDVDRALETLRGVPPTSEYFLAAKAQMANLYLHHKQNRRMFARCYEEVVEGFPTAQSYIHLGEAYIAVQEPDKAITAFEQARSKDPNDAELAIRIGRTLVTTHDYQRALRYYRDAVANDPNRSNLRQDLATLHWRLGDIDRAVAILKDAPVLARPAAQDDGPAAAERVAIMVLLAKIARSRNDTQGAVEALIQARVYQNSVLNKIRGEPNDVVYQQRSVAAAIGFELGEFFLLQKLPDKALSMFNEALKHDEANDKAMLALARLYLQRGDVDACEQQCNALLRINPSCEEATIMLADLMFRKNRYEDAAFHFLQLLEKAPGNANALVQYVLLLRRSGHLTDATAAIERAEKETGAGQKPDPGISYAKGLHLRYTNNTRGALREFNAGRVPKDNPWAQKCLVAMIECYIMPDNENLWEDSADGATSGAAAAATDAKVRQDQADNHATAEKLLKDVRDRDKAVMLECYLLMASRRRDSIDRALQRFFETMQARDGASGSSSAGTAANATSGGGDDDESGAGSEKMNVPCLVGMAIALQMMKQTPKARNHLKRMSKANYNPDLDDDYERGWLLLADIYIGSGKFDLAQELLKRAIQANKSCCRAWELMGHIYEKEQSYKDASDCYENAWRLVSESDPSIGYKLAFNYLKARKFVQAIDVCHKVLKAHPNYPKIRKEVLERARSSLRP